MPFNNVRRRYTRMMLIGTLAAVMTLSACSGSKTGKAADDPKASSSTLDQIRQSKVLRVGLDMNLPPYAWKDKSGEPTGYEVAVAKLMAAQLGAKLELVQLESAARIPLLLNKKIDLSMGNFTVTPERSLQIDFSCPVNASGLMVVTQDSSDISGLKDLDVKTAGVDTGGTALDTVKKVAPKAKVKSFQNANQVVLAIKSGQADFGIFSSTMAGYTTKVNPELRVVPEAIGNLEYHAYGVRRNDVDWVRWVNSFIQHMQVTGQFDAAYKEYVGLPSTLPFPACA